MWYVHMQEASVEAKGTKLQNYYGMIIRSNVGNLYGMKKG